MNAKYKRNKDKKNFFLHTLNGSGVAVGRALAAILENYYDANGIINIPNVLQPYMSGKKTLNL